MTLPSFKSMLLLTTPAQEGAIRHGLIHASRMAQWRENM
jgi:hypothetical protein